MSIGPYSAQLNFNVGESHSPEVMALAGRPYSFDALGRPSSDRPPAADRQRIVAGNPVACAQYFRASLEAFFDVLCGWPLGKAKQAAADCLLGHVAGYFVSIETSGRGALHWHAPIILPPLHALRRLVAEGGLDALLAFVNRVMCGTMPPGWAVTCTGTNFAARPAEGVAVEAVPAGLQAAACRPPLDGTAPAQELDAHVARAAAQLQMHQHSARCRKGGHAGVDGDCALHQPRAVVDRTHFLEGGCLLAEHSVGRLVHYSPTVMLALPVNHTLTLFCEASTWNTEFQRHAGEVAAGRASAGDAPAPPDVLVLALKSSFYSCKYTTKEEMVDFVTGFMQQVVAGARTRRQRALEGGQKQQQQQEEQPATEELTEELAAQEDALQQEPAGTQGKRNVRKLTNRMLGGHTITAAQAAYFLLGYADHEQSFTAQPLQYWLFTRELLPSAGGARAADAAYEFVSDRQAAGGSGAEQRRRSGRGSTAAPGSSSAPGQSSAPQTNVGAEEPEAEDEADGGQSPPEADPGATAARSSLSWATTSIATAGWRACRRGASSRGSRWSPFPERRARCSCAPAPPPPRSPPLPLS